MKRKYPERISLEMLRKAIGLDSTSKAAQAHFTETMVLDAWQQVLGPLANYCSNMSFADGALRVHVTMPTLRNDLFMQRTQLMDKLNAQLGKKMVMAIVFQ